CVRPLSAGATDAADGARRSVLLLSGPEGGLSRAEEALALQHGFVATTLGPRVLRAETAPLAALAALTLP
ncbi:RsmE family RNA methyltransferase, partial [Verminephrobacter aporrectodeae]|uniref:RsmE family RNA methyltransferase n=1 Tax=Verminephrobacter aporrectodeae TaxID=1110389 RepID=UPI000237824B